ncbi:rhodopsin, GQ-coupled-like [Strongylocentrotus purpuratus]|uniref:G-protein coupled receptors family 1 profile domain-containing protein n=1 Tax=Strongylocentrotus purpuratus TaxID=7668 RepID=A0A7M7T1W2_STRPU|nr:rhodopsin, GQ-coupled-like [Strongylocentrotus purpuratus]
MDSVSTTVSSTCGANLSVSDCQIIARFDTVLSPILLGLIVVGVLANSIMLYVIIAHRDMHTFPNLFVANLCMTHFLYLAVLAITDVVYYLKLAMMIQTESLISSSAYLYISLVITNNTCAMLTALSIERYIKIIVDPKKSAKFQRTRVAVISCIAVWTVSLIICAPVFYGNYSDAASAYSDPQYRVAVIISFVFSYIAPLVIITVIYFLIRRKLRKRGSSIKIKNRDASSSKDSTTASKAEDDHDHELKILKTVCFIVIIFTFNFGCLYITSIVLMILPLDKLTEEIVVQVSETIAIMTASIHPIVYGMTHPSFNPHVRRLILCREECCLRCRRCECDCSRCCRGGRPTSLRSVMRKQSTLDGTVNANDEFVLVERFEAEQSSQRQENI